MIWQHLQSIAWLRWRLTVNQWRRGGSLNAILGAMVFSLLAVASLFSFFIATVVGIFAFPKITPNELLLVWDVIVGAFLFMWLIGLVNELQKSEALSIEKLLHLPVSLTGIFMLNYFSSWMSMSLVLFVPTAAGLSLALAIVKGPALLILFPLLASFVIMVTALSHQFRGWLQVLMRNKRRRRTIVALVTVGFILIVQIPNLINISFQRSRTSHKSTEYDKSLEELQAKLDSGEIDSTQHEEQQQTLERRQWETDRQNKEQTFQRVVKVAKVVNGVLPVGWLPLGAQSAANGKLWPGVLGTLGTLLIGFVSLQRSYRVTLRFYTGGFGTGRTRKEVPVQQGPVSHDDPATSNLIGSNFLEKRIAGVPDPAAAVMVGGLRSILRGPEGKMLLLTPFFLVAVFSAMLFWRTEHGVHELGRPFLGLGAISLTMFSFVQALCNQFGYDRAGFRALVLSPCPRRHILLGKNLAIAPLAFFVGSVVLAATQFFAMMKFTHVLATVVQLLSAYMLFCLLGNFISVIAPSAVTNGVLKPAKSKFVTMTIQVLAQVLSPMALVPAAIALGVEMLLHGMGWLTGVPIYLLASLVELSLVIWLYRRVVPLQAQFLQRRETAILDAVAMRVD